ncbi:MAG: saccharopine dehydrogenase NADP-binding domain-containing protein [Pirellulales bacterium]
MTWLIYGANGFTGELIVEEALRRGKTPIVAARKAESLARWANDPRVKTRVFGLGDETELPRHLVEVNLVLNCAGPFADTAAPLMDACARIGAHYLDITGEIDVIEAGHARDALFRDANAVVMPAVGFDVVPSDCLAALLAARLPGAKRLTLAFQSLGGLSAGTAKTAIRALPEGGRVRIDGRITRVPPAWKTRSVPFAEGTRTAVTIPWGDVSSAFHSTGIPNIEVYTVVPPEQLPRYVGRGGGCRCYVSNRCKTG